MRASLSQHQGASDAFLRIAGTAMNGLPVMSAAIVVLVSSGIEPFGRC